MKRYQRIQRQRENLRRDAEMKRMIDYLLARRTVKWLFSDEANALTFTELLQTEASIAEVTNPAH